MSQFLSDICRITGHDRTEKHYMKGDFNMSRYEYVCIRCEEVVGEMVTTRASRSDGSVTVTQDWQPKGVSSYSLQTDQLYEL